MANDISELKQKIENNLNDESKPWATIFKYLEEVFGVNRTYIFWGMFYFFVFGKFFNLCSSLLLHRFCRFYWFLVSFWFCWSVNL